MTGSPEQPEANQPEPEALEPLALLTEGILRLWPELVLGRQGNESELILPPEDEPPKLFFI